MNQCSSRDCFYIGKVRKNNGSGAILYYCYLCHRAKAMICGALKYKKEHPGFHVIREMVEMADECPRCGIHMRLKPSTKVKKDVMSLQHNKDGSMEIICHSCNTSDGLYGAPYRGAVKALVGR